MQTAERRVAVHIVPPPRRIVNNSLELFAPSAVLSTGRYARSIHRTRSRGYDPQAVAAAFEVSTD